LFTFQGVSLIFKTATASKPLSEICKPVTYLIVGRDFPRPLGCSKSFYSISKFTPKGVENGTLPISASI